jgi:hypothetical protein
MFSVDYIRVVESGVQHQDLSRQKTTRAARVTVWHDPFLEALEYRGSRDAIVRWRKSNSQTKSKKVPVQTATHERRW